MLVTILLFLLVLGVLVFVHELGHFLAAKRAGLTVFEFGFGFPPRIAGIKRGNTIYSINWIPVGGFVKIKGETGPETGELDSFVSLSALRRTGILLAGVGMNVLLAIVLLGFAYSYGAPAALDESLPPDAVVRDVRVQILSVEDPSPAAEAGIRPGDRIISISGDLVDDVEDVQQSNAIRGETATTVSLERADQTLTVEVTPRVLENAGEKPVWGVTLAKVGLVSFPWYRATWLGVQQAVTLLWLKNLLIHQQISADIAGPVGIAALTGQVANLGVLYLIQFTALLSLNLALVNALPFPALDGGRVLFVIIEKFRGRKVSAKVETIIHNIGFALLLLLVLVVTLRDVNRLTGGILHLFQRLIGNGGG